MDVLISGAGVAGLMTAYWLRQYGFNPTIVERADALVVGGYKIDVRGTALEVLQRTGIHEDVVSASTHMQGAMLVDREGNVIGNMSGDEFGHRVGEDLEIVRGTLCQILMSRTLDIETIFGDSVASIPNLPTAPRSHSARAVHEPSIWSLAPMGFTQMFAKRRSATKRNFFMTWACICVSFPCRIT